MVTQEEYLQNRKKINDERTIYIFYDDITPDELIEKIKETQESLLQGDMGVDKDSMSVSVYAMDPVYPELNIDFGRWQTMKEYERDKQKEEKQYKCDISRLQSLIKEHLDEACAYIDELKNNRNEE